MEKLASPHKIVFVALFVSLICMLSYVGYLYNNFNIVPITKGKIVSEFDENRMNIL